MMSPLTCPAPLRRTLAVVCLSLCAVLLPSTDHGAQARGRVADVTTLAVAYNLDVQFVDGSMAGRILDAGVVGTLDSTGLLTATLTAPSGLTSTVTGAISAMSPTILTVQGKAGSFIMGGKYIAKRGLYGGVIPLSDGTPAGTWLLVPAPTALSLAFAGKITAGRMRGTVLAGSISANVDRTGHFHGVLALDSGSVVAEGHVNFGNIHVTFYLPNGGVIQGVAPVGVSYSGGVAAVTYTGTFSGPYTGDHGTWSAQAQ